MTIDIEVLSGDAGWPAAKPLLELVWPAGRPEGLSLGHLVFAEADLRVLVETEQQVVSHVGIHRREVTWNGGGLRAGGIGSVATHPDFRRRGLATVALHAAVQTLKHERAADFALLFCAQQMTAFYAGRGWKSFTGAIHAEQPGGRTRFDALVPMVYYLKRAPHGGDIDLCGLPW